MVISLRGIIGWISPSRTSYITFNIQDFAFQIRRPRKIRNRRNQVDNEAVNTSMLIDRCFLRNGCLKSYLICVGKSIISRGYLTPNASWLSTASIFILAVQIDRVCCMFLALKHLLIHTSKILVLVEPGLSPSL